MQLRELAHTRAVAHLCSLATDPMNVFVQMSSYIDIYKNSQKPLAERQRGLIIEGDRGKELSRLYRRNVYGFDEWREHRSVARYLRHMAGLTGYELQLPPCLSITSHCSAKHPAPHNLAEQLLQFTRCEFV